MILMFHFHSADRKRIPVYSTKNNSHKAINIQSKGCRGVYFLGRENYSSSVFLSSVGNSLRRENYSSSGSRSSVETLSCVCLYIL